MTGQAECVGMPGYGALIEARLALSGQGSVRQRVIDAGLRFWEAIILEAYWPPRFRCDAERLVRSLTAYGPLSRTVNRLEEHAVEELADRLLDFIGAVEEWHDDTPAWPRMRNELN